MAASVNMVFLLGHLGRDPELKYSQNGNPVTRMSLATNEYSKDGEERTEWHTVIAFGQTAENCVKYLQKGSCVHVEGSLRTRAWENQAGERRFTTEVIARRVQFLEKGQRKENQGYAQDDDWSEYQSIQSNRGYDSQTQPAQSAQTAQVAPSEGQQTDDVPF